MAKANIKVAVRFRNTDTSDDENINLIYPNPTSVSVDGISFAFDKVFPPVSTQEDMFYNLFNEQVDHVLDGFSSSVIAYGQTASGKSFTMMGNAQTKDAGLIPRALNRIQNNYTGEIKAIYVELYQDSIRDLFSTNTPDLANQSKLKILRDGSVKEAVEYNTLDVKQLIDRVILANTRRATSATKMNACSSRSHSILTVELSSLPSKPQLVLVDLAGSEMVKKTGASGNILIEAGSINKSLTCLAMVINKLAENKDQFIPYRESKLTQLLQNSIGGSSKTCIVISCSPLQVHKSETISSLRFGARAKLIQNKVQDPVKNEKMQICIREHKRFKQFLQKWKITGPLPVTEWLSIDEINGVKIDQPWIKLAEECKQQDLDVLMEKNPEVKEINSKIERIETTLVNKRREIMSLKASVEEMDPVRKQHKRIDDIQTESFKYLDMLRAIRKENNDLRDEIDEIHKSAYRRLDEFATQRGAYAVPARRPYNTELDISTCSESENRGVQGQE